MRAKKVATPGSYNLEEEEDVENRGKAAKGKGKGKTPVKGKKGRPSLQTKRKPRPKTT